MRRRRFLASVSAAAATGLAGCSGTTGGDTPERTQPSDRGETPTPSRTRNTAQRTPTADPETATTTGSDGDERTLAMGETFRTSDGRELTVSEPAVHRLVLAPERVSHHLYHRVTAAPANRQYLTFTVFQTGLEVETSEEPGIESDGWPASLSLAAAVYGERYTAGRTVVGDDNSERVGRVGIPVPLVDAPGASVVWERPDGPSPEWELPDEVVTDLSSAPRFEVRSVEIPSEVNRGDPIPVRFTVANTGDREGRFLAECDVVAGSLPLDETSVSVPAGDDVTRTVEIIPDFTPNGDAYVVVFDWGRDWRRVEVSLVERTTRSG